MKVSIIGFLSQFVKGEIIVDQKTKELVKRLHSKSIAIIHHTDLDEMAAESLVRKKPLAIVNFSATLTGKYPARGAEYLLQHNIPLFEIKANHDTFKLFKDGMSAMIQLKEGILTIAELGTFIPIKRITKKDLNIQNRQAQLAYDELFHQFALNTIGHAQKESSFLSHPLPKLHLKTHILKRIVIIVARGSHAYQDFEAIKSYVREIKPILIGVDGGADIIYEHGFIPDIVIGDMDSVSTHLLYKIKDRVVHSYTNGHAPGHKRLDELQLNYFLLPSVGTSEDLALRLAFEYGAYKIILIGSHTHMVDFLEKGRPGMGSTLLTRMKMGHILIDAKGIHNLVNQHTNVNISYLFLASVVPVTALLLVSPELRFLVYTIWLQIRMFFY